MIATRSADKFLINKPASNENPFNTPPFFKKKQASGQLSCASHAISNRIEVLSKGSVYLLQPGDFGGDFSIADQNAPIDASRRAGSGYNLQSHSNPN